MSPSPSLLLVFNVKSNVFLSIAPGAVGHLSFTEILDTSLKVSWREPHEKNGILTGTPNAPHHNINTPYKPPRAVSWSKV